MIDFLFNNAYFVVNILTVITLLVISWLLYDASRESKKDELKIRAFGFLLISISTVLSVLFAPNPKSILNYPSLVLLGGLILIIISVNKEPIIKYERGILNNISPVFLFSFLTIPLINICSSFFIAYEFRKRQIIGLRKEYRELVNAFVFLGLSSLFEILLLLNSTNNIFLGDISKNFGFVWILLLISKIGFLIYIFIYSYNYLRFRIYPLIFSIITSVVIVITIVSALFYSLILFNGVRTEYEQRVLRNVEAIQLDLNNITGRILSYSNTYAISSDLQNYITYNQYEELDTLIELFLEANLDVTEINVTDDKGNIVATSSDEKINNSISNELFINRAIGYGEENSGRALEKTTLTNYIILEAVSPVIVDSKVIGVVQVKAQVTNEYVDNLKDQIGSEVIIFAEDKKSATTFYTEDGTARLLDLRESNQEIIDKVLKEGDIYTGTSKVLDNSYFSSYVPIFDARGIPIGMIFSGIDQYQLVLDIEESNRNLFMIAMFMSLFSLVPSKLIADFIDKNYKA